MSIYERACRMAGITSSSRIARELVNNKVFLDYAGLNTQDIKAVCVALLVRIFIIYDYFSLLIKRKCIIGYNKKSRVLRLFLFPPNASVSVFFCLTICLFVSTVSVSVSVCVSVCLSLFLSHVQSLSVCLPASMLFCLRLFPPSLTVSFALSLSCDFFTCLQMCIYVGGIWTIDWTFSIIRQFQRS